MRRPILTRILCLVAIASGGDLVLNAQTLPRLFTNEPCQKNFEDQWNAFQAAGKQGPNADTAERLLKQDLDPRVQAGCLADLLISATPDAAKRRILTDAVGHFVSAVEKQAGSSVSGSGSTNPIAKNFASSLFSVANEYGALTSSTSGQTTTLSGSLDQLPSPFAGGLSGVAAECAVEIVQRSLCVNSKLLNFLGRINYSASLDLSQPSTITGTATGQASGGTQQVTGTQGGSNLSLSQFTAKILILGGKPSMDDLQTAGASKGLGAGVVSKWKTVSQLINATNSGEFADWEDTTANQLLNATAGNIQGVMNVRIALLPDILVKGNSLTSVIDVALGYAEAIAKGTVNERQIFDKAMWSKPLLSAEYDFNTPANQPTNSTFRFIYGQSLKSWKITANGAVSIYDSQPSSSIPGASRLRDTQFGAEGDYTVPVFTIPLIGKLDTSSLGLAYYFQDQTSPAILNVTPSSPLTGISFTGLSASATQVFTQAGHIHLGQAKLILGSSSTGFSLPISVTASNRTELINNNKILIRPQVGINYSFDSLLTK